jgi:hypothetical protein
VPWFRVEDNFHAHPKVVAAGNAAIGLWLRAGCWAAQHLTDGHVPKTLLPALGGTAREVKRLVDAGLWKASGDGWEFHDWNDYQPSRVQVMARREEERQRLAKLRSHRRKAE